MYEHNKTEFQELINIVKEDTSYWTSIGRNVLWLPVQVPQGVLIVSFLSDLFRKYKRLTKWAKDIVSEFDDSDIKFVETVCDEILEVLNNYLTGDVIKAYELFSRIMDSYFDGLPQKKMEEGLLFYRMRTDMNLKTKEDFYHLPLLMRYKCNSERFSIAGYPCFYVGYSKKDCLVEISKTGSMIGMSLKKNCSIQVLDLTFSKEQEQGDGLKKYLRAFPLIASCYVVTLNDIDKEKAKFREEYVIPQMLTSYLKHKGKYEGICYYSVRNENLNPLGRDEDDYRNIVLFPNLNTIEQHDMELMDKFNWYKPFNVR